MQVSRVEAARECQRERFAVMAIASNADMHPARMYLAETLQYRLKLDLMSAVFSFAGFDFSRIFAPFLLGSAGAIFTQTFAILEEHLSDCQRIPAMK